MRRLEVGRLLLVLALLLTLLPAARAGSCQGVACVSAGPILAQVDSAQGPLLNGLLGGLLGTSLQLGVADWNGLARSSVSLPDFLRALQTQSGALTPDSALSTQVSFGQFVAAAGAAARSSGSVAALSGLGALSAAAPAGWTARVGDLLRLDFGNAGSGGAAFSSSRLNLLNLVTGGVQLFNSRNTLTSGPAPVSLGAVSADLSALGAGLNAVTPTITLAAQVTEPPVIRCGPAGTQFYTASVRIRLDMSFQGASADVDTSALPLSTLGLSGLGPTALTLTRLTLYLDVARAQGVIGAVDALSRALNLQAAPGVSDLYLGRVPDDVFWNRSRALSAADVQDAQIGQVAARPSVTLAAVTTSQSLTLDLFASSAAEGVYPTGALSLSGPFPVSGRVGSSAAAIPALTDTLAQNLRASLSVDSSTPVLSALAGPVSRLLPALTPTVKALSGQMIRPLATAALQAAVDRALSLLGVGIGQAEFTALGVNTSCVLNGAVYLDAQPSGTQDAGESWPPTGAGSLYAVLPGLSVAVPAGGHFSAVVGEGTTPLLLSPDSTGTAPAPIGGLLFVNPVSGTASVTVTPGQASVPDPTFGLFAGDRVDGAVYRDDGRGGGAASNARQDGSEPPVSAGLLLSGHAGGAAVTRTGQSGADGRYTLWVPAGWSGITLGLGDAGSSLTGMWDGASATLIPAVGAALRLPDPGGTARRADLGVVALTSLGAAPEQVTVAPATLHFRHLLTPGTLGTLSLSAGSGAILTLDRDCDGTLSAAELAQTLSSVTVDAAWPRSAAGDLNACLLDLAFSVAAGTAPGTRVTPALTASLTWSGNGGASEHLSVTDAATVTGGATLVKTVINLTRAPQAEGSGADAYPGDRLRYCLTVQNPGAQAIVSVVMDDTLPAQVAFLPGTLTLDGAALSDASGDDAGEVSGMGRAVRVRLPQLAAGASARTCFEVRVL